MLRDCTPRFVHPSIGTSVGPSLTFHIYLHSSHCRKFYRPNVNIVHNIDALVQFVYCLTNLGSLVKESVPNPEIDVGRNRVNEKAEEPIECKKRQIHAETFQMSRQSRTFLGQQILERMILSEMRWVQTPFKTAG